MDKKEPIELFEKSELFEQGAFQVWEHFASVGGHDKDRMISVSTWLLAFSGMILGYSVTEGLSSSKYLASASLAVLGALVSLLAAYVTLMYGGYANRNWAVADGIASLKKWHFLLPDTQSRSLELKEQREGLAKRADKYSRSFNLSKELAPIFTSFWRLALFSLILHIILFCASVWLAICR
jgi:hypothetical protein